MVRAVGFGHSVCDKMAESIFCVSWDGFASLMLLPGAASAETNRGPDIVIVAEENRMVYEFRQNGQLRYMRIVPNRGKPYYLVPTDATKGNGDLERVDSLVASWVLWEFD